MLVLTRVEGEKVVIGENITIAVNAVAGRQVTLAIKAPREVPIVREELLRRQLAPPD